MTFSVSLSERPDMAVAAQPIKAFPRPLKAVSGPIGIFWDIENCPIPVDVNTDNVAANIRMALRVHPAVQGSVTIFSAYGDFNQFPRRLREGCQRTGINLIDVPNGRKDASDKAILVDMFLFALDNPPPCTILLITGDVDFAPALHKLGQRGYTVLLVLPAAKAVASALCNAGRYVWDWPSVARGEGFVPAKVLRLRARERNEPIYMNGSGALGCQSSDDSDALMEDEICMQGRYAAGAKVGDGEFKGNPHPNHAYVVGTPVFVHASFSNQPAQPLATTHMCTHVKDSQLVDAGIPEDACDESWIQPGDIEGLKNQLIMLLKLHGGSFIFSQVAGEYKRMYGRPLFLSEYGSQKLADLLGQMGETFVIATVNGKKELFLQECTCALQAKQHESKGMCGDNLNTGQLQEACFSSTKDGDIDLLKEVILLRAKGQGEGAAITEHETLLPCGFVSRDMALNTNTPEQVMKLEAFKRELQELLVSHAYRIPLANFWKVYHRRYARELNLAGFGVVDLDGLLKKMQDVATVVEEQGTQRFFLVVSGRTEVQTQ